MKKSQKPIHDPDKFDGGKAVGCLFVGIILLIVMLAIGYSFITNLRVA